MGKRHRLAYSRWSSLDAANRAPLFLVESDAHVCRLVRQFLGEMYAIETFDDGYVALDHVRRVQPVALLTEVLIPNLDGLALCKLLKGDRVTMDVPILVVSVLAASDRAKAAGANAFLRKPLEKLKLQAADPLLERGAQ